MLSKSPAIDETTPAAELDIDVVLHRFDELTGTLYEIVTDRAPRALARRQLTIRNFEARLRWTHGDAFDALDLLQLCCEEVAQALFTNVDNAPDSRGRAKNELLYRLLTRACLTTSEIHAQLRTGHPLGARARWRTLHEIHVVLLVQPLTDPRSSLSPSPIHRRPHKRSALLA
ncbi:MAG TPA: hypothetical protein DCR14_06735 [Acidimicrobiaceae bacterium]|nr:hypothetical protein [Acidimicrobiaceae bacterium]